MSKPVFYVRRASITKEVLEVFLEPPAHFDVDTERKKVGEFLISETSKEDAVMRPMTEEELAIYTYKFPAGSR
jgi:hypothetical protein